MITGLIDNIDIPLYNCVINVAINKNCAKALKFSPILKDAFYKKKDKQEMLDWHGAYLYSHKKDIHVIVLRSDCSAGVVAHECFHAAMNILQMQGVKYCQKSEEAFAYFIGWLTDEVMKFRNSIKNE